MDNQPILDLQQVSKIYGAGATEVRAVDRVNLQVKLGEIVLIMGSSGSGKTTLLSMAGLLLRPSEGLIHINGQDTTNLDERKLPAIRLRSIGFVFQAYNLIASLSALENVELVMHMAGIHGQTARRRALELLDRLGLRERMYHLPADLSGGQKQRVAIARALANNAPLILADEPTGNLDSKSGQEVVTLLSQRWDGDQERSVVIVTHDHRLIDIADRILWLEDGHLTGQPDGQLDGHERMAAAQI